jgi:hypothetical protein
LPSCSFAIARTSARALSIASSERLSAVLYCFLPGPAVRSFIAAAFLGTERSPRLLLPRDARVAIGVGANLGRRLDHLELLVLRPSHADPVLGLPEALHTIARLHVMSRGKTAT